MTAKTEIQDILDEIVAEQKARHVITTCMGVDVREFTHDELVAILSETHQVMEERMRKVRVF